MLVLTRKERETIVVRTPSGEEVRFLIVDLRGDRVRIGIEAPPAFDISREEVLENVSPDHMAALRRARLEKLCNPRYGDETEDRGSRIEDRDEAPTMRDVATENLLASNPQ